MGKFRWQIIIVFVALMAIGLLLIGQQPSLLPETAPQIQPTTGGVYSEALIGSAGRFNPVLDFHNPADQSVDRLLFSSLVVFDSRGLPVGDLAETWGISQDGKVYNFSLRANAKWHDGTPVTSADILFTIDLLRKEQLPIASDLRDFWSQIEVRELDEKTLQLRLTEPFAPFMDYLTFGILPRHILGGLSVDEIIASPFNLKPVGSGPFQFSHLLVENGQIKGVVLTAFQDY